MRLVTPPSTLSQQKRAGYLLVAAAFVLATAFTVLNATDSTSWTHLLPVYLVAGLMAAVGASQVVAARRGRLRFDEQRRQRHFLAGYRAFWILFLVVGTNMTFDLLEESVHVVYLAVGLVVFYASLFFDRHHS